jgi:formylglycine-generating enzyme required for sulfatase activity
MVYVPAGTYQMGSNEAEIDDLLTQCDKPSIFCNRKLFEPETPPHTVTIDHFWIDQFEVTNAQFVAYLNEFGNWREGGGAVIRFGRSYCRIQEGDGDYWVTEDAASHPVVMVSWYGAEAYCQWVRGRLPTEAEWEYAGRGPEAYTYPWGNDPPTLELTRFNSGSTVSVGGYPDGVSWCGAYDMAGNVWEWTADWFGRYPTWLQENPTGPATGTIRVLRGGGWHSPWQQIRLTFRLHDTAPSSYNG